MPPIQWYSWDENLSFYARINMPNYMPEDDYAVNNLENWKNDNYMQISEEESVKISEMTLDCVNSNFKDCFYD